MRIFTFEVLSLLVATAAACGGKAVDDGLAPEGAGSTSSSSGGTSRGGETNDGVQPGSSSSGATTFGDCGPITTNVQELDETLCEPQLVSQMSYAPSSACGDTVCQWSVTIPCGADGGVPDFDAGTGPDGGDASSPWEWCRDVCTKTKPANANAGPYVICNASPDGNLWRVSCGGCGVGRPPSGFVAMDVDAPTAEGAWLARMAQLEAASVEAFHALHDDLATHGAPESLLRLVRIAAEDEVRHASLARGQAERRGARVPEIDVHVERGRSLEQLALENAREGCIEETFGAVVARIQADRAREPALREMLEGIARDELGHAFLAWRIAEWLAARIADGARERVREARAEKLAELRREVPREARIALDAIAPALA
jgi:hypothetical protein